MKEDIEIKLEAAKADYDSICKSYLNKRGETKMDNNRTNVLDQIITIMNGLNVFSSGHYETEDLESKIIDQNEEVEIKNFSSENKWELLDWMLKVPSPREDYASVGSYGISVDAYKFTDSDCGVVLAEDVELLFCKIANSYYYDDYCGQVCEYAILKLTVKELKDVYKVLAAGMQEFKF